ncbi:AAA family ATPase [Edaphocola aurantiacus]|uniref:AAA family ATPase n=1 Tax=Edaphocola aurantiacus TaxID=2601682 RepID=UPI001C94ADC0|nr:MoxR family ATPase [Edaphocola aurantiacus]
MTQAFSSDVAAVQYLQEKYATLKSAIGKIVVGQSDVVEQLVMAILCNGHSLLVGVPGLAKTLLVKTLADAMDLSFKRIQFTPDLMPGDITGSEILDENRHFKFIKGPVFANIILADEINRTPPKTQAALLEAMQERTVTVAGVEYPLPQPFFVLATQNPIEQEGTYPLPEAQLDRFMFLIKVDYPSFEEELQIVKQTTGNAVAAIEKVLSGEEIIYFQSLIRKVPVPDNVLSYAVKLAQSTRPGMNGNEAATKYLAWGAGPRASQNLVLAAKCHAVLHGKFSPDIEDVKVVAAAVLRHRIVLNYKAATDNITIEKFIEQISA